jgi:hypothetical protein
MTALVSNRPAVLVRAYAGNWINDCPLCRGAQLTSLGDRCVDCGLLLEVRWPSDEVRYGVERLLSQRPISHTRNWSPGESLHDLLAENVQHGIGPAEPGQVLSIVGDTITQDTLPVGRRQQIGA